MQHPYDVLRPEYEAQLSRLVITRPDAVDGVCHKLIRYYREGRYGVVPEKTGIPLILIAGSFEREASSNFSLSPAQGDRWDLPSVNVPAHRGPFRSWEEAALDAYHIDHLDSVGRDNWTWPLVCYYAELFNGFGYRDAHHIPSPYAFGATNVQRPGKYVRDHVYDATVMDTQLGVVAMAKRMVELAPELALPGNPWPFPGPQDYSPAPVTTPVLPAPAGLGGGDHEHDALWIQQTLNHLGQRPAIGEDGNYGKETKHSVELYQAARGLTVDGLAGPETIATMVAELK